MKKRGARIKTARGLHGAIHRGIRLAERERRANEIARPMRNLMDKLATGEVDEIDGQAVMRMPEIDAQIAERAEWCAIAPAIDGWRDCWARIAPDLITYRLGVLADRLRRDEPITKRLVEQAREEFDATVARIITTPDGVISSAITTTQIAWEFEKQERAA